MWGGSRKTWRGRERLPLKCSSATLWCRVTMTYPGRCVHHRHCMGFHIIPGNEVCKDAQSRPRRGSAGVLEQIKKTAADIRERVTDNLRNKIKDQMQDDTMILWFISPLALILSWFWVRRSALILFESCPVGISLQIPKPPECLMYDNACKLAKWVNSREAGSVGRHVCEFHRYSQTCPKFLCSKRLAQN